MTSPSPLLVPLLLLAQPFIPVFLLAGFTSCSEMFGSFTSPDHPSTYPRDTEVQWNISVPDGFSVRLYFSHFDLEPSYLCEYDYVKVVADGETLALFCGRDVTDTEAVPSNQIVSSPRNQLTVHFRSDFSNEETFTGFKAHYSAQDIDECISLGDEDLLCDHFCHNYVGGFYCSCRYGYQLHTDNRTCTVECSHGVFRERAGVLSSVDYPSPYPKRSDCCSSIELDAGFTIRLLFDPLFDVEDHPDTLCPYDYVKVSAGSLTLGLFCGSEAPALIDTQSNNVTVCFHSDDSGENKGWRVRYTSTGSVCATPVLPANTVMSPVQSEYSFTDHILFTCTPGTAFLQDGQYVDQVQLQCLSDGSWSRRPPVCHKTGSGRRGRALSSRSANHSSL